MNNKLILLFLSCFSPLLFAQGTSSISTAGQTGIKSKSYLGNPQKQPQTYQPIIDVLPIWRAEAKQAGYDLPLPIGVVGSWMHMSQSLIVDKLIIDGEGLDKEVSLENTSSVDNVYSVRLDAWLFPFLNLYGVVGHTSGSMQANVRLKEVDPLEEPAQDEIIPISTDYSGTTYGGGLTVAAGYKSFFAMIDANTTRSELSTGTNAIYTTTVTPRVGILLDSTGYGTGTLWLGAMYVDVDQTLTAQLPYELGTLNADLSAQHGWNGLLGGSWELNKRYSFQAEAGGLADRKQFMLSAMIRF